MIAEIKNGSAVGLNAVSQRGRRMIHTLRAYFHTADFVRSLGQVLIYDTSRELTQFHGKIMVLHLTGEYVMQRKVASFGSVNGEVIARHEQWRKKWKALNMIPMRVREQNRRGDRA